MSQAFRSVCLPAQVDQFGLAAAALLCFAPFLVGTHGDLVPTFYAEWLAMVLGLALFAAAFHASARSSHLDPLSFRIPWISIGLAALAGVLALQVLLARVAFPERNALGMLYMLWAASLACAGARLRDRLGIECVARTLQSALAAAGFLLAIVALMQRFDLTLFGLSVAAPGNLMLGLVGQRNHLANLLSCGLISLVFLATDRRLSLATAALAAVPMLLALPLIGSRSVLIYALILTGSVALPALTSASRTAGRSAARLAAIAGGALVLLVLVQVLAHGELAQRVAWTFDGGQSERWPLVLYAWAAFIGHPILGTGWGELAWASLDLAPEIGRGWGSAANHQAHNLVLQLAAETGLLGAACIVLPLAAWFVRFPWRAPQRAECWLVAIASIQLWHGLVEYPQWYAHLLGPFALVLGLGSGRAPQLRLGGVGRLLPVAAIAAGALALWSNLADYRALQAWRAEAARGSPEVLAHLLALRGGLFAPRVEALLAMAAEPSPAALELTRRALRGHPAPALARRYAELLDQAGKRAEAARIRAALAVLGQPST